MNSVELRQALHAIIPAAGKYDYTVYTSIIAAIMRYYFTNDVSYDYPEAFQTFAHFLKTGVLQF